MGDDKKINITYETLFEMRRNEKNRDELQKLQKSFLEDVKLYLSEKQNMLKSSQSNLNLFSEEERDKTSKQLENIKKILKELYEKRERKIVNMALNKSRTNTDIIDTSPLLEQEKPLFDDLTSLFNKYRSDVLLSLFEKREKTVEPKKEEDKEETDEDEAEEEKPQQEETKLVRFLHAVPKFMGKELEVYGPFDEEDVASLPLQIADLLIKKGRAEELSGD